ncbi:tRNA (adenosine(37)-N6)-threonylcarbamoyltransferase complex dimerization subunit type 1 TsaB [Mycoplasma seminis]|uniref:tRNA (Adenosine(37)-N6)-threonylcarbamoyltransferase complex dimerization subunit type 1 TsaB n=1 Tax=Mycoplasma seminis TaxID=512749 RepID=A0ABY9HCT2_9MOLU|nr:tRNA (adenosine(37)-N6)-threonylcarbamoyltransferase complex dimerization subunit type 1 TsaB [Mycoplasma seminis]WLP85488.1 tRNA (adenosine(37)-N6)-threonylcarbamoyltransferase complex dimerization subunit type 1 TsaB [Mycoplasma seminis]
MNVFLDTSSQDFVLVLFDQEFRVLDFILLKGYKKKVELITQQFAILLERNNLAIQNINALYTNVGPGFFTGIRSSLVFFRTLALLNNIKMYITTTMDLIKVQYPNTKIAYTDAQGNKLYQYEFDKYDVSNFHNCISVVENHNQTLNNINYDEMIKNFAAYKNCFRFAETMEIEALYIKLPQIGGVK